MNRDSSLKHYTRGGQLTLHNIRMFMQITNKLTLLTAVLFILISGLTAWFTVANYERYVMSEYLWAQVIPLFNESATTVFIEPNGRKIKVKYTDLNKSTFITRIKQDVSLKLLKAFLFGLAVSLLCMYLLSRWLKARGLSQSESMLIKGDEIATKENTKQLILNNKIGSDLSLAGLPLIKNTETAHVLFHGTTGTGKSNAIKELLDQIRARGDRAIIYDKSCNFVEEFYQPKNDILLNPLDERGQGWDLWAECRDSADFDSIAAAQIPMPPSNQDPFWVNAARTIFSAAAFEMRNDEKRSIVKLLQALLTTDLQSIQTYLKGTEAERLVSDKIEKTADSIRSVLATYLKSLKYVNEGPTPFSIRAWIQKESSNNWLFITSLGDRHETLKPLITTWLDIAVNSLLSLEPSENRRIWLILDELASLQQLPYLTESLSQSRKFGGCIVVGIQNYAQLTKLYGHDGGREISALLNTRYMFRQPDPDMARWSAINFGETFIDEVREGTSYGANTIRDGISINRVETRKQVVSFSEIMSLANLYAYVRLPGQYPITLIDFIYKARKRKNVGFIRRDFDEDRLKKISALIEKYEKPTTSPNESIAHYPQEKLSEQNMKQINSFDFDM